MKTTFSGVQAIYAKSFKMDTNSGTYLYHLGDLIRDEAKAGIDLSKLLGEFSLMDRLRDELPCTMDIDVELVSGGQDKAVVRILDFRVTGKSKIIVPLAPAPTAKA